MLRGMTRQAKADAPPTAMLPSNAIDDWLGGFVVFWVVLAAIVGGSLCAMQVFASTHFKDAVERAPLMLAWGILLGADGALAWAGLLPGVGACWSGCRDLWQSERRHLKWIGGTLLVIVGAVVASQWFGLDAFGASSVTWPLREEQSRRMMCAMGIILLPCLIAILGMWVTAVQAFDSLDKSEPDSSDIANYLELRERLQNLLWFVGIVIAVAILATGALRRAMLDGGYATDTSFPEPLILAYGTVFTLLLIISYVPPYILFQRSGTRLVHHLSKGADVHAWNEDRKKLSDALNLGVSLQDSITNLLAILAPIVAGLVSLALPDK